MDISPSTAVARPQFATFGPGFIAFSRKSHKNRVRHCERLSSPRGTRSHLLDGRCSRITLYPLYSVWSDYPPYNRSARSGAQVRSLSVLLPERNQQTRSCLEPYSPSPCTHRHTERPCLYTRMIAKLTGPRSYFGLIILFYDIVPVF